MLQSLVQGEARLMVSPCAGLVVPADWAHGWGIHRDWSPAFFPRPPTPFCFRREE